MAKPFQAVVLALWASTGCAGIQTGAQSEAESFETARALESYTRNMLDHAEKGDFKFLAQQAAQDAEIWDVDEKGQPVTAHGKAQIRALFAQYARIFDGAQMQTEVTRLNCRGTATEGLCFIDLDQRMSLGERAMPPTKTRATLAVTREGARWVWTHWHASMREPMLAGASMPAMGVAPTGNQRAATAAVTPEP